MDTASNAPEFSVTELSGAIRRTMEDAFGRVRVRGEIAGYRGPSASGHVYFALKDANARIEAVIWKGVFARLRAMVDEGLEVIATGKITTFAGSSKYQIVIDEIEPAGEGALLKQLEERKRKLAAEGLFAAERKKPIPFLPDVIGVITSPTGAVIRDMLHRISDRFPRHVLLWPVRVQGDGSVEEIKRAIIGFNDLTHDDAVPRPDVLIVARGGGSLEDLWGFNDEGLARVAATSGIPLISAVGHETDTTLIDFVSDFRAPTPTAAAERAVPVRADLLLEVRDFGVRLGGSMRRNIERRAEKLRGLSRGLPHPESLLASQRQRLDFAATRLPAAARQAIDTRQRRLGLIAQRLAQQSPATRLARFRERLDGFGKRLTTALDSRLKQERQEISRRRDRLLQIEARMRQAMRTAMQRRLAALDGQWRQLTLLSHTSVLARGFALVKAEDGRLLRSAAAAAAEARMMVTFADGEIAVHPEARPPVKKKAVIPPGQGDLF